MNPIEATAADAWNFTSSTTGLVDVPAAFAQLRNGVYVDWRSTRAGVVELKAANEHRIRIHTAAEPVSGRCSEVSFTYARGDMDIMPADYADTWQEDRDNTSLYLLLSPSLLHRTAEELGISSQRADVELRHQFRDSHIEHIAWALNAERRAGYENGPLYAESLGTALAVRLLRHYATAGPRNAGLSTIQLQRVRDFIEANLDLALSLSQLAAIAGISASHFKTLFRRSIGMPVHQYVMRRRVERARELLLYSKLSISQIALDIGFSHQSHMARCMKLMLGIAPSALRQSKD